MNITLTGNLGSGKTTICNILKKRGYEIVSTGKIFREIAEEKKVSVIELNEMAKKDRSIDDLLDDKTTQLGKTLDHVVFDSRLAWNFVPESFKVFLLVDMDEAARRVFQDGERNAESYASEAEAKSGLLSRAGLEKARFQDLYQINYYNAANYNLIIESTAVEPERIADEIISQFQCYQEKGYSTRILLNTKEADGLNGFKELSLQEIRSNESIKNGFFMDF